jgi:hypothetical protein
MSTHPSFLRQARLDAKLRTIAMRVDRRALDQLLEIDKHVSFVGGFVGRASCGLGYAKFMPGSITATFSGDLK